MKHLILLSVAIALGLALAIGCASGTGPAQLLSPPAGPRDSADSSVCGRSLWGLWDVAFDPSAQRFDVVPLRGAMFQANVTKFLQPPSAPIHLLTIQLDTGASNIPAGYIVCDITLKHPFIGLPRFRGFDVLGIVMGDASLSGNTAGELWPAQNELRVVNADGYTRWWNPTEFTTYGTIFGYTQGAKTPAGFHASGIVNGFKYLADDLEPDEPIDQLDLAARGTFSVNPGINTRLYEIQFPTPGGTPNFHFNYAITASYYAPTTEDDPTFPVGVFPMSANMAEAFRISVTDAGSTAYYVNETTYGGDLDLDIEVFDWGLADAVSVDAEILALEIGSDLIGGWHSYPVSDLSCDPGSTPFSRIFHMSWTDVTPSGVDGQELFIKVLSAQPSSYAPDIPGISGFDYPEGIPLAACAVYEAEISPIGPQDNQPPIVGTVSGPDWVLLDSQDVYALSDATDPEDGTELTILWDNDGDGDFADDLDGDDKNLDGLLEFPTIGFTDVVARAVDSGGLMTDSAPFLVYVEGCPSEVHEQFSYQHLSDGVSDYYSRMDSAFQTVGEYAGYLVIQNKPGEIRAYDTTQSGPWGGIPYIDIVDLYNAKDFVWSIDVDDNSGRVIVAVMNPDSVLDPSIFYVHDVDGAYLTTISVTSPDHTREVCAIDTDQNGDIWLVSWEDWHDDDGDKEVDPGEGSESLLRHFVYQEETPYYVEDPADVCDISEQFPYNNHIWDIAVSYSVHRIFVLKGNFNDGAAEYGELYCWDIAPDGTLTFNESLQTQQVFPGRVMGSYPTFHGFLVDGDIVIDHSHSETEGCRLILMAQKNPYDGWGHYFMVMDTDLNVIDTSVLTDSYRRYKCSIRQDKYPFNRCIVTSGYNYTDEINLFPAPAGW